MKIYDISWPLSSEMTGYKNKKVFQADVTKLYERDRVRESSITISSHAGTHIDAPAHFVADGITIEKVPLDSLVGPCRVIDLSMLKEKITRQDLEPLGIIAGQRLLFKTKNSMHSATAMFDAHFIYLGASAAAYLAEQRVKAVGIDYLGIERSQPDHETHTILLRHTIAIIEGLRLVDIPAGDYFLCCLPLAVNGLDAAPGRAVLIEAL